MRGKVYLVLSAFALIGLAIPTLGQNAGRQKTASCPVTPAKIQMQSYTAELKITSVQKLADGTTITRENKEVRARDSQGRFLNTNGSFALAAGSPGFTFTHVNDPVERTQTTWDSQSKKARVLKLPPADQRQGCWADEAGNFRTSHGPPSARIPATARAGSGTVTISAGMVGMGMIGTGTTMPVQAIPRPSSQNQTREDLGTTTIMGIEAHGSRTTHTTPVGEMGNDRPLVRTDEFWTAPGIDFPLRQVNTDPQNGTRTTELVSLDRSEPDAATFQPPEGYEIVIDELHEVPCQQMNKP